MPQQQMDRMHRHELLRSAFPWVVILILMLAIYSGLSFLHSTGVIDDDGPLLTGTVIQEPSSGVLHPNRRFRIKLESGATVSADGIGNVPPGYRGLVEVRLTRDSGRGDQYFIVGGGRVVPLNKGRQALCSDVSSAALRHFRRRCGKR